MLSRPFGRQEDVAAAEHCLNCGAQTAGSRCESCGLNAAAASLLFRRRLLMRTGFFLLGTLAFLAVAYRFPPLELDGMLIFAGVLFFAALALAVWVERGALRGGEIELAKRIFLGLVPVPWLLAGLLWINANFDHAPTRDCPTAVVGKFAMSAMMPSRQLVVYSCREGKQYERVTVNREDFYRFAVGDHVIVRVHEGLAGIPWIAGVSHD
jgi:hypothetical protein